jgi:hypothetical protein
VHVRAWQVAYRGLLPDEYLDGLRAEDRAGRYTFGSADPGVPSTIVAVVDGVIRGFATVGAAPFYRRDGWAPDGHRRAREVWGGGGRASAVSAGPAVNAA